MMDRASSLLNGTALNGHHDITFGFATDADYSRPVNHSVAASTTDWCPCDFAAFRGRLLQGDVFGMQVDESANDPFQPSIRVMPAKIAIAGVEIDADS